MTDFLYLVYINYFEGQNTYLKYDFYFIFSSQPVPQ